MNYYSKYLKYKQKYNDLQKQLAGNIDDVEKILDINDYVEDKYKKIFEAVYDAEIKFDDKTDIIKAYKKISLKVHPDKFLSPAEKNRASQAFIKLTNAKEKLILMVPRVPIVPRVHSNIGVFNGTFKAIFKDRKDWPVYVYAWSSQPSNSRNVSSNVWDENGIGKTVNIKYKNDPDFGYDYVTANIAFSPEAFSKIFHPIDRIADTTSSEYSITINKKIINIPNKQIYIFGESNHAKNKNQTDYLKKFFFERGSHIFGEAITENEHNTDLDTNTDGLRVDILLASLYTKALQRYSTNEELKEKTFVKRGNMLYLILINEKIPQISDDITKAWSDLKKKIYTINEIFTQLKSFIETWNFDFKSIYEYYFQEDEYNYDMQKLLSVDDNSAFELVLDDKRNRIYGKSFETITQTAREKNMIKKVEEYISKLNKENKQKIIIFTGLAHMEKLNEELSKKFSVVCYKLIDN